MVVLKLQKFYHNKTPTFLKDVDIEMLLVSNKIPLGEKNYKFVIGYLCNDNKGKPLHMWCVARFGISHYMVFAWSFQRMHANALFYLHIAFVQTGKH